MNKFNLLIIEDAERIREELGEYLRNVGYDVHLITDFKNVLPAVQEADPHLILLDINLPYLDGYSLCRDIRKQSDVPIIVVTSRDHEMDELMSMNLGADDFVKKPYHLQILVARMEAVLKRAYKRDDNVLIYGSLQLNLAQGSMMYQDNEQLLTKNELKVLHYLIQHQGKIVPREQLMEYMWSSELYVDDNTLSVNVTRLRKKIEGMGMKDPIETRRGLGYRLP